MTTPLLTTKLYLPSLRPNLVSRPRLIERLETGLHSKLTLISAPAGFGKTTLVSDWARRSEREVVWLSLDADDNEPRRFFSYLIAAIQGIEAGVGSGALAALKASDTPQYEPLLTHLINEIAALACSFTLALDDYHLIENQAIHEALTFFIDRLPAMMHLVIASRVDPPLPLSRLRARVHMTEIRSNDLRFTEAEIAAFLNDLMGLGLSREDVAALGTRTEGWIASLQLAALSMQGRQDKEEFVAAFSGSHHYIIDYLADEVISRQPEEIRTFLCRTSILNRFCAPLCDALLEISTSRQILQQLEGDNLFLIPLDDERHWFRYHHLFADFLSQRLEEQESKGIPALHHRAAAWFEQHELIIEAVNHSLVGQDYQRAAQLVERIGPDMMMQSEFDQLSAWLDALPQKLVSNWPWLCIIRAWMCQRWARLDEAEQYLQYAEQALAIDTAPEPMGGAQVILGQIAAIRALNALTRADIPQAIDYANQALEYLPEDHFNRAVAADALGIAKRVSGDFEGAIKILVAARRDSLAVGNHILAQAIMLELGRVQILQGRLTQAAETFREAIQVRYQKTEIKIPYASAASVYLGDILREWNDLAGAMTHLGEGIEIGKPAKMVDAVTSGYAIMARVYLAQGDLEAAIKTCQNAERMANDIPDLETDTLTKTLDSRIRLLLAQNKSAEAARCVQERGLSVEAEIENFIEFEPIILARVLIYLARENSAAQELSEAQTLLTKILEVTKPAGYMRQTVEALALQALVFDAQGKHEQALHSLAEVLSLAEPEGYVRTFIDEGEPMRKLLRQTVSRGIAKDYAGKLLAAFEPRNRKEHAITAQSLLDPLSERELDVLKLLATELSGPEIARELMISLNTMRTHTKNIYNKLGVNNRRAAVFQAEAHNLI